MRYYSTQHPVEPGTFPQQEQNKVLEIHNFDHKTYCEEIGREAWGYIDYEKPIARYDSNSYELACAVTKTLHFRYLGTDSWGRYVYEDENGNLWKLLDCCSPREVCEERGDIPHSAYNNAFDGEPDCPLRADIDYVVVPETNCWYPVTVSSCKHGGGLKVNLGSVVVKAARQPEDKEDSTKEEQSKTRYFNSLEEAQRIASVLQNLTITTERVRMSVTQGEVKVFINGQYILNFGDKIVLPEPGTSPEDYYGDDIGGWRSSKPDSGFVLGLIWHPFDYVYHYSDLVCSTLGIKPEEWIEGEEEHE